MAYTLRIDNKKAAFVSFKAAMHRMSSSGRQSRPRRFHGAREEYSIWRRVSKTKPRHVSDEVFEVMWSDAIS